MGKQWKQWLLTLGLQSQTRLSNWTELSWTEVLCIRWPMYWSFNFSMSPSKNIQGWFPLGLTGWILLQSKRKESEVTQLCPTLCDPMDCSISGSSIYGIFQARVLEWVAISFSRESSCSPKDSQKSSPTPQLKSINLIRIYIYISLVYWKQVT